MFIVIWESEQNTGGFGIYGQRYDVAGNVVGSEFKINIEDTKGDDIIKVYDWSKKEWGWSPIDKILNRVTKEGWSHIKTEKGYELIAGERRWRASKISRKQKIPAYVINVKNDMHVLIRLALMYSQMRAMLSVVLPRHSIAYACGTEIY